MIMNRTAVILVVSVALVALAIHFIAQGILTRNEQRMWDNLFQAPTCCDANLTLIKSQQAQIAALEEQIRGVDHFFEAYRIRFETDIDFLLEKVEQSDKGKTTRGPVKRSKTKPARRSCGYTRGRRNSRPTRFTSGKRVARSRNRK